MPGDRPLRAPGRGAGGAGAPPRRRSGARPKLFPVRDDARAARLPALPARRAASKSETRALAARWAAGRRQARQPGHLLRAERRYAEVIEKLRPGAAEPGEIVDLDGRVLGRHDGVIHFTVGQRRGLGHRRRRAALRGAARRRCAAGGGRPARGARHARAAVAEVNWLGDGAFDEAPAGGGSRGSSALDAAAGAGAGDPDGPARRGSSCGGGGGRRAWPGLRLLGPRRPGARRRLDRAGPIHPTCSLRRVSRSAGSQSSIWFAGRPAGGPASDMTWIGAADLRLRGDRGTSASAEARWSSAVRWRDVACGAALRACSRATPRASRRAKKARARGRTAGRSAASGNWDEYQRVGGAAGLGRGECRRLRLLRRRGRGQAAAGALR